MAGEDAKAPAVMTAPGGRPVRGTGATIGSSVSLNSFLEKYVQFYGDGMSSDEVALLFWVGNIFAQVAGPLARDALHWFKAQPFKWRHIPIRIFLDPAAAILG